MNDLPAKPTKFAGIEFRSRTEARLAVCFEQWGMKWRYEPEFTEMMWKPDFLIAGGGQYKLIELKPCLPTGEYVNRLCDLFDKCRQRYVECDLRIPDTELWCIDFYGKKCQGLRFLSKCELEVIDAEMKRKNFDPGNNCRFDLRGG